MGDVETGSEWSHLQGRCNAGKHKGVELKTIPSVITTWSAWKRDHPETDVPRLMVVIERLLQPLLQRLATRSRALTEIRVGFRFERLGDHIEKIRPAAPTLDLKQLLELIRLRLQAVTWWHARQRRWKV